MGNDDFNKIRIIGGDGDTSAQGVVDLVKGIEGAPCFMCRHWEKDEKKLVDHFISHDVMVEADGSLQTPIAKDFPGRVSMRLNVRHMGWCRFEGRPTEDAATCNQWDQVTKREDMLARMSLHDRTRNPNR